MSKIIIFGDVHAGIKDFSVPHHDYMKTCIEYAIDYAKMHSIKDAIQVGDLFDERKKTHTLAIEWVKENFVEPLVSSGINLTILVGNHDSHFRETLKSNNVRTHLGHDSRLTIVDSPMDVMVGDEMVSIVPWVCNDNSSEVDSYLNKTKARYCFGHFEFDGFEMQRGQVMKTKHDHKQYKQFSKVISGHYHTKSVRDNVTYTGTPYQLTWIDWNDDKGFWVLDTDLDELTFHKIPFTIYSKIDYSDGFAPDVKDITGKYVKISIDKRVPDKELRSYKEVVTSMKPLDVKYYEYYDDSLATEEVHLKTKDTIDLIRDYINASELSLNTEKLIQIMESLYRKSA